MYRIKIELDSFASDKFNQSLLSALDVVDSSERVAIPSAAGSGFVCRNKLEQGLGIVYWDLVLKSQLVAQHKVTAIDDPDNSYAIVYVLAGGDMNDAGTRRNAQEHTVSKKTILFVSANTEIKFEIPAGKPFKFLGITCGREWLKNAFEGEGPGKQFMDRLLKKTTPLFLVDSTTPAEFRILLQVEAYFAANTTNLFHLKTRILDIVGEFFPKLFNRTFDIAARKKSLHYDKIMEVEIILRANLENKFPSLDSLAEQTGISNSTLKRQYQIIFGKGIYQHYLEMKMDHAMVLLRDHLFNVNEVATKLHYENVSGFIGMFRKHHGVLPGSLKRKEL